MTLNIGSTDRIVRFALAAVFFVLAFVLEGTLRWVFGALGAIMLVTGAVNFCPIWAALGISTLRKNLTKR
jgi:Protein of unknown function (DUF2892)